MRLREAMGNRGALGRGSSVRTDDRFDFDGGLNLADPPMSVAPGQVLGAKNFIPGSGPKGGYARTAGYERYDGQTGPTDASYIVVNFTSTLPNAILVGDDVILYAAGTSTVHLTGTIAYLNYTNLAFTAGYLVVVLYAELLGGGAVGDDIRINTTWPTATNITTVSVFKDSAQTDELNEEVTYQKTEYLRSLIGSVGGAGATGAVLGVQIYLGNVYAFRKNATPGGSPLWKATSTGWENVLLGIKLRFEAGETEIAEGDVITGATSTAFATVNRVVVLDGMWETGDASGYLITDLITNDPFTAGEDLEVAAAKVAEYVSDADQTIPDNGTYYFRVHNFKGVDDNRRMYGVNGVGQGFEFDGTVFVLNETGMEDDRPNNLGIHNDHLLYSFPGGSMQNSSYQKPLVWNPITGADERSCNATVTGIQEVADRVTCIFTRDQKFMWYGDVVENFQLRTYAVDTGAIPRTIGLLSDTIFLDDRGMSTLAASAKYGNFAYNTISSKIEKLIRRLSESYTPVGAYVSRKLNTYFLFWKNGTGIALRQRQDGKRSGWMPVVYPDIPSCFCSAEVEELKSEMLIYDERVFMGAEDGYVYELDKGRSFDGEEIEAFLRLAYHHSGSPEAYKRYRRAQIDVEVTGPTSVLSTLDFNYGNRAGQAGEQLEFDGGGGFWDIASWGEFLWSGAAFDQIVMKIEGSGYNIGFFFYTKANDEPSHTLYGVSMQYSPRRINRGTQEG